MAIKLGVRILSFELITLMQDDCYHVIEMIGGMIGGIIGGNACIYYTMLAASTDADTAIKASDRLNNDGHKTIVLQRVRRSLFWKGSRVKLKDLSDIFYK